VPRRRGSSRARATTRPVRASRGRRRLAAFRRCCRARGTGPGRAGRRPGPAGSRPTGCHRRPGCTTAPPGHSGRPTDRRNTRRWPYCDVVHAHTFRDGADPVHQWPSRAASRTAAHCRTTRSISRTPRGSCVSCAPRSSRGSRSSLTTAAGSRPVTAVYAVTSGRADVVMLTVAATCTVPATPVSDQVHRRRDVPAYRRPRRMSLRCDPPLIPPETVPTGSRIPPASPGRPRHRAWTPAHLRCLCCRGPNPRGLAIELLPYLPLFPPCTTATLSTHPP